jgi:hypothetical protein
MLFYKSCSLDQLANINKEITMNIPVKQQPVREQIKFATIKLPSGKLVTYKLPIRRMT